ncbi:hypothetical protein [Parenemella sanctibonifatiensis]|uniref:Uncharacterized protein n=1 Tax=Parenemella sanctibonifatiensis TaxID=2016505 RepID=A0A255ELH1_9ACTN|nr:hypothetical protein [Parenemella sanctibonifatiensis]OYN92344.1 hypothetical protein CGZ91_02245 [Parenemella sanctibonifatiensis]
MPTYVLDGGNTTRLPARPLTLRVQGAPCELRATVAGQPAEQAILPAAGTLVLPRIDDDVEVAVVPLGADEFGAGSRLTVTIGSDVRGEVDPERAVLSGVDVSGLRRRELVVIRSEGSRVAITAQGRRVEAPLSPLATAARDLCRSVLGAEALPPAEQGSLALLIDTSASMHLPLSVGAAAVATEILVGVGRVYAPDETPQVYAGSTDRSVAGGDDPIAAVTEQVTGAEDSSGFDPSHLVSSAAGQVWVMLTDGLVAATPPEVHPMVAVRPSTWQVMEHRLPGASPLWCDLTPEQVGQAESPAAELIREQLLADPNSLRVAVLPLLRRVLTDERAAQLGLAEAGVANR